LKPKQETKDENVEEAESDEINQLKSELDEKKKELEKKSYGKIELLWQNVCECRGGIRGGPPPAPL
jgi:hypothetical protein